MPVINSFRTVQVNYHKNNSGKLTSENFSSRESNYTTRKFASCDIKEACSWKKLLVKEYFNEYSWNIQEYCDVLREIVFRVNIEMYV